MDWHIDGRDVFVQDWETREEMSIEEAEGKLNRVAQLEADIALLLERAESAEAVVAKIPQTIWENITDELYEEEQEGD